ncbi:hypothetical protein QGN29_07120 [Temperatibacter marinus]|uniref:HPt domain-containing protein n=1 Tax=Temperatibacter marinus TaxID=1456591 RepID=A0AA52EEQ1_9PROT|nr:hypothetical protein [Temperatibacter marinus]WND04142.1 hypothetical protein QGN29_07120 [Temperatibacter marinus]
MEFDDEMLQQFLDYLDGSAADLKSHTEAIMKAESVPEDQVEGFYGVAHNLKGMGMTFGYNLLTEIGADCCKYIKELKTKSDADANLLADYCKVFNLIIEHRISGDGGEKGQAIVARMREKTAAAS